MSLLNQTFTSREKKVNDRQSKQRFRLLEKLSLLVSWKIIESTMENMHADHGVNQVSELVRE